MPMPTKIHKTPSKQQATSNHTAARHCNRRYFLGRQMCEISHQIDVVATFLVIAAAVEADRGRPTTCADSPFSSDS